MRHASGEITPNYINVILRTRTRNNANPMAMARVGNDIEVNVTEKNIRACVPFRSTQVEIVKGSRIKRGKYNTPAHSAVGSVHEMIFEPEFSRF
jgi:hypothetical protein